MTTRLPYRLASGHQKRAVVLGLEADIPAFASVPPNSYYLCSDTGALFVASATLGDWTSALSTAGPSDASTTVTGVVEMRTNPAGNPVVLTTDDLAAANGVATADGSTMMHPAQIKPITAGALGGLRQGTNFTIGVDGTADITTSGAGLFGVSANGTALVTEPIIDFEDSDSVLWTVTDDSGGSRVKVAGAVLAAVSFLTTHLGSLQVYGASGFQTVVHLDLTQGTWVVVCEGVGSASVAVDVEMRITDGTTIYGSAVSYSSDEGSRPRPMCVLSRKIVVASTKTVNWQISPTATMSLNAVSPQDNATRMSAYRIAR